MTYLSAPQGFSLAVRVLNLSTIVAVAVGDDTPADFVVVEVFFALREFDGVAVGVGVTKSTTAASSRNR